MTKVPFGVLAFRWFCKIRPNVAIMAGFFSTLANCKSKFLSNWAIARRSEYIRRPCAAFWLYIHHYNERTDPGIDILFRYPCIVYRGALISTGADDSIFRRRPSMWSLWAVFRTPGKSFYPHVLFSFRVPPFLLPRWCGIRELILN